MDIDFYIKINIDADMDINVNKNKEYRKSMSILISMYTFIRVIKVLKFIFLVSAGTNILNKCNTIVVGHLGKQNSLYRFPGFKLGPKCQDVWFGLKHGL